MAETTSSIYATGKRKTAVARIWLAPGSGAITVNGKSAEEYFERMTSRMVARQSLEVLETADKYDVRATVVGGATAHRRKPSVTASPGRSSPRTRSAAAC